MKQSMLKTVMAAVAVGFGLTAFAADEPTVTLGNGKPVAWSEFVKAWNNGIKGDITKDLPEDNAALVAYNTAVGNLETAEADSLKYVDTKDAQGNTVKGIITQKTEAVATAQGEVDKAKQDSIDALDAMDNYKKTYVDPLEQDYNDKVALLAVKKDSLNTYNTNLTTLTNSLTSLQAKQSPYTTNISNWKTEINGIPKITTQQSTTVEWLKTMQTTAQNFQTDFANYISYVASTATDKKKPTLSGAKIYCSFQKAGGVLGIPTTFSLVVSYISVTGNSSTLGTEWTGAMDAEEFYTYLSDDLIKNQGLGQTITSLYIYLGPNYKEKKDVDEVKAGSNVILTSIPEDAVKELRTIASDSEFKDITTIPTNNYTEENQKLVDSINELIKTAQAEIDKLQAQIDAIHDQIDGRAAYTDEDGKEVPAIVGLDNQITYVKGVINSLENTDIPAAKTAWENAQKGIGTDELEKAYKAAQDAESDAAEKLALAYPALKTAKSELADAEKAQATANSNYGTAYRALITAEANAQAAADALVKENYNNVELNGDVNAAVATGASSVITSFSGTITGNNHVINVTGGNLFGTFSGTLKQVAINGSLTNEYSGKCYNVAIWDGATGEWYNNKNVETTYASLGALGNAARATFGVDFANKKLTDLTTATKVYDLTVYEINKAAMQMYATISNNDKGYYFNYVTDKGVNTSYLFPANTFAKCGTVDITTDFANLPNIFYGANNTCDNVVITDKVAFSCPVDIAATTVTYKRAFEADKYSSLVLPFAVTSTDNMGFYTFDTEKGTKGDMFWFTKTTTTVNAKTPMLFKTTQALDALVMSDVTIVATSEKIVSSTSGNGGVSFGTFQKASAGDMIGESRKANIYGLSGGEFHPAETSNTLFTSFRMAIASDYSATQNPAPRKIRIRDEFGNDITEEETTGIKSVEAEATSLGVTTAQGQIIFTSEADYGTVQVYGIDGRVAANATVMAGTTAIDVPAGMYIVLGKKVLVK